MLEKEQILNILSLRLRRILEYGPIDFFKLQEIRLRMKEPFIILYENEEFFVKEDGALTKDVESAYKVCVRDIRETLEYISNYSLYAYEDEIKQGFITVQGGHRIGLAGKVILEEGQVKSVKHISFINIRIAHEQIGCGKAVLPYIYDGRNIFHTLIISPPGAGKTTLLRDIIRLVSNGTKEHKGLNVGLIDERSEIGACFKGVPQNDVGMRTDIFDACPKASGMLMMIRSMTPAVIAVDEIGTREDIESLSYVMNCGCNILATVHGNSIDDVKNKPILRRLVEEKMFKRFIILSGKSCPGTVINIFDERGSVLYDRSCS